MKVGDLPNNGSCLQAFPVFTGPGYYMPLLLAMPSTFYLLPSTFYLLPSTAWLGR